MVIGYEYNIILYYIIYYIQIKIVYKMVGIIFIRLLI